MNKLKLFIIIAVLISCSSKPNGLKSNSEFSTINSITVSDNKITLLGQGFEDITEAKISIDGDRKNLSIESKTDTEIVLTSLELLNIGLDKAVNLIFANAQAAEITYPVSFELANNSINLNHFSSMGAAIGQILSFNGSSWESSNPKFLNMALACNATNKGTLRFNTDYENYQFCDGTFWREIGNEFYASSKDCIPADYNKDIMVSVGDYCVDKYEMSIWDERSDSGVQGVTTEFKRDGSGSDILYAISKKGVTPTVDITWYQAAVACANSGKSLIPDSLWQIAALGTFDPQDQTGTNIGSESDSNGARCNIQTGALRLTGMAGSTFGSNQACISRYGVEDMVGNVREWTDLNGTQAGISDTAFSDGKHNATGAPFRVDATWNVNSRAYNVLANGSNGVYTFNTPAAAIRGGDRIDGSDAGMFALTLSHSGSYAESRLGARCARVR